jgi:predicted DNA-binding protein
MKKQSSKARRAPGQTTLTISLPQELKERIEKAAEADERSTSNYLVKELSDLLARIEAEQETVTDTPTKKPSAKRTE